VCCLLALAPAAWANTYTPNKTSDPKPDGCKRSDCSLREAIIAANHHPGADAVILHSGKAYKLSIGPLKVTDAATIRASGSKAATVDGGEHVSGVFESNLSRGSLALTGLVIKGASPSSWVTVFRGGVHILHCLITDNFAETGAGISIVGGGDVSVVSSTVTHNVSMDGGGGIEAQLAHWLTIDKSSITNNSAGSGFEDDGGGIDTSIPTVIRKSTISGNETLSGNGGGIAAFGNLTMTNDTVALNSAGGTSGQGNGGGLYIGGGTTQMNDVTVARNKADISNSGVAQGGGIDSEANLSLQNSLVVLNKLTDFRSDFAGTSTLMKHNMFSDGKISGNLYAANPKIGPLAHNGGPTETIALLLGSPAINKASPTTSKKVDQRGYKRDSKPDIGAYEFGAKP
jgi:CSLREA domain-containing protein